MPSPTLENPALEWERQDSSCQSIASQGMETYCQGIEGWEEAFVKPEELKICCMDEGNIEGIRAAGSLLLLEPEERIAFCLKAMAENGTDHLDITSHQGCGAAAIKYKQSLQDPADYEEEDFREFTEDATKTMVDELNQDERLAGKIFYAGMIMLSEMKRPAEQHIARAVYYDGSGRFNPTSLEELPAGFVISRRYQEAGSAIDETALAAAIAFGDHGYGDNFNSETPFLVIAISDADQHSEFSTEKLEAELKEMKAGMSEEDQKRILIDTCLAPKA